MMIIASFLASIASCLFIQQAVPTCLSDGTHTTTVASSSPYFSGQSIDVILSAKSYLVWDVTTGEILKEKNADEERPIASINKLVSILAVRQLLLPDTMVAIPPEVKTAQQKGADIQLRVGEHAKVSDLIAAALIPSANDAMVTLAIAAKGSEEAFVDYANQFAQKHGLSHTKLANATGLNGGIQYSTARDVKTMMTLAYADPFLRPYMTQGAGDLVTQEGTKRHYVSTDKLLGTYLPVLAAKTGYTIQAGENVTIIVEGPKKQPIGVVILASESRFYDAKILVEWILRNFTWP